MPAIPVLKVVIVGDGNVGKTSLVRRYCEGMFSASRVATIGVDFQTKLVRLEEIEVKLSLWDMAGQDRFQSVRAGFYKGSRAAAMIYDVTDPVTLANLARWRQELAGVNPMPPVVVVGNKTDLPRAQPPDPARAFAESIGASYLETSAATGEGVPALFETLARLAFGPAPAHAESQAAPAPSAELGPAGAQAPTPPTEPAQAESQAVPAPSAEPSPARAQASGVPTEPAQAESQAAPAPPEPAPTAREH
jgi:small GTP-binding protein